MNSSKVPRESPTVRSWLSTMSHFIVWHEPTVRPYLAARVNSLISMDLSNISATIKTHGSICQLHDSIRNTTQRFSRSVSLTDKSFNTAWIFGGFAHQPIADLSHNTALCTLAQNRV